ATNLANSDYTIIYNLTGANTASNQSAIIPIASGGGSFAIPASLLINAGTTTLTIVSITNNTTGCTSSPIVITDTFLINPLPDTTGTTVSVTEPICLGNGTLVTINSPLLANGTYTISYDITGANTVSGTASITLTSGNGTFVIQASELVNAGNYMISITAITNPTTVCAGTSSLITDTFVVNPRPELLVSEVTIANICVGSGATVSIASLGGLTDGNYDFTYSLSGSNGPTTQTVSVLVAGGIGSINIPSALLPNIGLTSLTINTILNTGTTCSNTLTTIPVDFNVNSVPTINPGEMSVANVCLAENAIGTISNAANLSNGNYTITYNLSGANTASNQTTSTAINGGNGTFDISNLLLSNTGSTTITITAITNTATGCSTSGLTASASFNVIPLPDVTGADVSVSNICINSDAEVSITGATGLTNGNYTLVYDLSGANTSTDNSISVLFNNGASGFTIPGALLLNGGSTLITIQSFSSDLTQCGANTITLNPVSFTITDPQTATLNADGNLFCIQDRPTIGDLTSNVDGNGTITWYNAPSDGNAYNVTDALVNETTYYATVTDVNGCVSSARLEVLVDLTACDDLFIPDGFSPNGDQTNDEFYIKDIELLYPNFQLEIYNRYGNMVYKGNLNTPRFNGKANQTTIVGKDVLPTGVYFYILNFNDASNTDPKQGRLYLSR
ncbi:MAG: gliding motility-associated C-terminal domain-containing protein, partial [Flavobacterium sp.]